MKKTLLICIFLAAILAGCKKQPPADIAATTLPVFEFTVELCQGTGITVSRLVTENVSCLHDYTLQVSQMRTIESAKAVIMNGAGLDDFLEDVLAEKTVIDASSDTSLSCGHSHGDHQHDHDPHIWLSPKNAKQMCSAIYDGLCALFPEHAAQFKVNLDKLHGDLDALQAYGETTLRDLSCRDLITFHDGFAYFAESFDLHILRAIEEESGSEASAQELCELIDLVNSNKLPAVFTEINGSTGAAMLVAEETGCRVYSLDMAMAGSTYFEAMYRNIHTIKEALG